ncbi:uncharacterized protein [Mytilus edulis]|uniref:uncharacterized protein n=1 Tax=Mytilus edulis TaxID=6550 RepID=UPI0039EEA845
MLIIKFINLITSFHCLIWILFMPQIVKTIDVKYLGCYKDDWQRMLDERHANSLMTLEMCKTICYNRRYLGLQNIYECFCGDSMGGSDMYTKVTDTECNHACGGNSSQICGGPWRNSVYEFIITPAVPTTKKTTSGQSTVKTIDMTTPGQSTVKTIDMITPGQSTVKTIEMSTPGQSSVKTTDMTTPEQSTDQTNNMTTPRQSTLKTTDITTPGRSTLTIIETTTPRESTVKTIETTTPRESTVKTIETTTPRKYAVKTTDMTTPGQSTVKTTDMTTHGQSTVKTIKMTTPRKHTVKTTEQTIHAQSEMTTSVMMTGCLCPCSKVGEDKWDFLRGMNLTLDQLADVMEPELYLMRTILSINKSNTTRMRRSKTSASDDRVSAKSIGCVGVVFICLVTALFVFFDSHSYIVVKFNRR